jgi:hypothetical protein
VGGVSISGGSMNNVSSVNGVTAAPTLPIATTISYPGYNGCYLTYDPVSGYFYTMESGYTVYKISIAGVSTVIAGGTGNGYTQTDGTGTNATFIWSSTAGITVDLSGNVYVFNGNKVRKITSAGVVTTVAGSTTVGNTDGVGTNATFNFRQAGMGAVLDTAGTNIYFFDSVVSTNISVLRKLNLSTLQVTTIPASVTLTTTSAGLTWDKTTGTMVFSGGANGSYGFFRITTTGTVTQLYTSVGQWSPMSMVLDAAGVNIYYVEFITVGFFAMNTATGVQTRLGGGPAGGTDGVGLSAGFYQSGTQSMTYHSDGNIYMYDYTSFRKIVVASGSGGILPYNGSLYTSNASTALTVQAPLTCAKTISIQQIQETLNTITSPGSGTVAADWSTGDIWYVSSMSANFTINITNLPTTANKSYSVVFTLNQGSPAYYISALQIAGVAQTIKWATSPSPQASHVDVIAFTLMYTGSAWTVLGQLTSFG